MFEKHLHDLFSQWGLSTGYPVSGNSVSYPANLGRENKLFRDALSHIRYPDRKVKVFGFL